MLLFRPELPPCVSGLQTGRRTFPIEPKARRSPSQKLRPPIPGSGNSPPFAPPKKSIPRRFPFAFTLAGVHSFLFQPPNLLREHPAGFQVVAYRFWTSPKKILPTGQEPGLRLKYGSGQPSVPGKPKSIKDSASIKQFDSGGSLVIGQACPRRDQGNTSCRCGNCPGSARPRLQIEFQSCTILRPFRQPMDRQDSTIRTIWRKAFDRNRGLCT